MNLLILYGTHEAPAIQDIYFNNPFRVLEAGGELHFTVTEFSGFRWKQVHEYSLVIVSRIFQPELLSFIRYCRRVRKPVFFFFDDDILHFPEAYYLNHEPFYRNNHDLIVEILQAADALVVSTEKLRSTYQDFNRTLYVTPPNLDTALVRQIRREPAAHAGDSRFRIGYAGSFGHVVDFRFLEGALLAFYRRHHGEVELEFMGCVPELFRDQADDPSVTCIPWQADYRAYLTRILQAGWDLALCPVLDSEYTSHKTNIKFLEYSAAAIPGIYSRISIYSGDITDGRNGFLAENTQQAWTERLEQAFRHRRELPAVAAAAHEYVMERYAHTRAAALWRDILAPYRKEGWQARRETWSIRAHKARRVYAAEGLRGLAGRLLGNRDGRKPAKEPAGSGSLAPDQVFSRLEKAFDRQVIRKQVLFIIPWLSVGGGDMVNLMIAEGLDRNRYAVHFLTTEPSRHEWDHRFRRITPHIFHLRDTLPRATHFWEYNQLILEYIRRARIDTVLVSNSAIGYTCVPAIRQQFPYIRIVDILHGQGGAREGGGFPAYSAPYDPHIDQRITVNEYLKEYLITQYGLDPGKIRVIHNGMDTETFSRRRPVRNRELRVSYIGRLNYEKHPEKVLEIAAAVRARSGDAGIRFQLIGDGPMYDYLENEIRLRDLEKWVTLRGHRDQILRELERTDLVILCSEMEGLPIVLLEALSMSIPCLATRVGGIPELIGDGLNGYLVDFGPGMAGEFADRILTLRQDPGLRERMGQAGRTRIEQAFSLARMKEAYTQVINHVNG